MDHQEGDTEREPLWRWTLVWIGFSVYGVEAGAEFGLLGIAVGVVLSTLVTLGCFGVVRALGEAMADGPTIVPPRCLRGCCEGYGSDDARDRYAFLERDRSGDLVRCGCGDRYHLTPDTFFGAQTMSVVIGGAVQPVAAKKVLGPWRWLIDAELRRVLVERLDRRRGAAERTAAADELRG